MDCKAWLPESSFNRTGVDGKFWTVRCKPCKAAYAHGTTVAEILRIQGSAYPECAACGARDDLKVDHDHECCPASRSSGCCIRGYLCHACNAAEGLLKTPERAIALAAYMQHMARREGKPDLAAIA
ncbi:endonuclease domain-containing protein [Streptomyces microflavus]|uniref:endonuclease domain-containing protein n=1 Tax=Streptomyces microflavus TaxID=1919 RepID=UPI0033BA12EF